MNVSSTTAASVAATTEEKNSNDGDGGAKDEAGGNGGDGAKGKGGSDAIVASSKNNPVCCSICKKIATKLMRCGRCKSDSYLICGRDCQKKDWKRHKREECLDAMPKLIWSMGVEEWTRDYVFNQDCTCRRCTSGITPRTATAPGIDADEISEFFNRLDMLRGRPEVNKRIDYKDVPLTEEELHQVAYPHPRITFSGAAGFSDEMYGCKKMFQTYAAPNGKAFTVLQLAKALAKSQEHNKNAHHRFFEGLIPHRSPHTFIVEFGS